MKIEKVNDHQIRCTLTKADLADRELKISELAYGTEKAKTLFRDMMQQAAFEFGFEAEDIPLMIEAIPLNSECIVLIITKVEDPEELDTRFSKFAPSVHDSENGNEETSHVVSEGADDVLDLFKRIHEGNFIDVPAKEVSSEPVAEPAAEVPEKEVPSEKEEKRPMNLTKIYQLDNLDSVTRLSRVLRFYYQGTNSLYKNKQTGAYTLVISKSGHTPEEFNKICNMISEYATPERFSHAGEAYLEEHYEPVVKNNAVQSFALI